MFAGFTCAGCHSMPAGTNGDRVTEVFVGIASTGMLDVSHLRQLRHKDQGAVDVIVPSNSGPINVQRARGGFGIAHEGINVDLADFIRPGPFQITSQDQVDMTAFVRQFDQGIAPAAHRAWLIDPSNKAAMEPVVASILLTQSGRGWVDIAAIGHEDVGGTVRELRWAFDAASGLFSCHDNSLPQRAWDMFFTQITGPARYLIVGLPPANAKRFALDPDNDDLTDAEEAANFTMARNRDSDGDGYDDGYEVQVMSNPNANNVPIDNVPPQLRPGTQLVRDHSTATFAKFYAQFNEPVTWELQALDMNESPPTVVSVTRSTALQREAMIHMHELYPSTEGVGDVRNYAPRLIIRDPRGNPTTITGAAFATTNQLLTLPRFDLTIDNLQHQTLPVKSGDTLTVDATVRVRYKAEVGGVVPVPGRVVVAHVLRKSQGSNVWSVSSDPIASGPLMVPTFDLRFEDGNGNVSINPYSALPGDFLLSTPTDTLGNASFNFSHSGLVTGDDVRISIVAILEPFPGLPNTFDLGSLLDWDLPTTEGGVTPTVPTASDLRGLTTTF